MSGFRNARFLSDAQDAGKYTYASFRKAPTQTTGAGVWFDLSMSPGNPAPNYYIGSPNVFVPMKQSTDGGLRHGGMVNAMGSKKHLRKIMSLTTVTTPVSGKLLDYLGFYGFVDESVTDEQPMDNTVGLTRYTDGAGVQLTRAEYELLRTFVLNPGIVLTRDRLLASVTHRQSLTGTRTVDVMIKRLRAKFGDDPKQPQIFGTSHGEGYVFTAALA